MEDTTNQVETQPTISDDITHVEPLTPPSTLDTEIFLEHVWGHFPQVTTLPTWTPKTFKDGIAVDTTLRIVYYYDFTNNKWKHVGKLTGTTTSSATPTINTDNIDYYSITAQTVDITSFTTNLSGTPKEGQTLWISITGTAARAITWGTSFESSTVSLPTTTVSTNRLDVGFVWNSATSKWRCVAVS